MSELPPPLSGKDRESFAYFTIKDRLPVILTKVIDKLHRDRSIIADEFGDTSLEAIKSVIAALSKLKNEMQTDKSLVPIEDERADTQIWNDSLEELQAEVRELETEDCKSCPTWFTAPWLWIENYMYRRIQEALELSKVLKSFDPFKDQKEESLMNSMIAVRHLLLYLESIRYKNVDGKLELKPSPLVLGNFLTLLKICLWGNRCDLSLSAGASTPQDSDPIAQVSLLEYNILVNDSICVWDFFTDVIEENIDEKRIDLAIVLDNSGFELFADLCFAHFLTMFKFVKKVHFYVKDYPWYVSDVTSPDICWMLKRLQTFITEKNKCLDPHTAELCNYYGDIWSSNFERSDWIVEREPFWTLPFDYSQMSSKDPDLYRRLKSHDLIIFKGDLNYRKLVGDLKWDFETEFKDALRGFHPTAVCALRTLKADVVVGVSHETVRVVEGRSKDWLTTGEYAVIQVNK